MLAAWLIALTAVPGARVIELELIPTGTPQIAVWIEDRDGRFVDTIMVTRLVGTYGLGNRPGRGDLGSGYAWPYGRREMALPVWAHRRGVEYDRLVFQDCHENAIRYHNPISSSDRFFCRPTTPEEYAVDAVSCPTSRFDSCKGMPVSLIDGSVSEECAAVAALPAKSFYPPRNDLTAVRDGFDWSGVGRFAELNDLDAISTATPPPNTIYHDAYVLADALAPGEYSVWIEVSLEGDFNEYHRTEFFHDPVEPEYGIPFQGQPSIVWRVPITLGDAVSSGFTANYVGYGSSDGTDGLLRAPDATITTSVAGSGAERLLRLPNDPDGARVRVSYDPEGACGMPAAVADLRATAQLDTSVSLAFTAIAGASYYDVRYSLGAIAGEADFEAAIRASSPDSKDGLIEVTIDRLQPGTKYSVAVRAHDACGDASPIKTIEVMTATPLPRSVDACFIATAVYGSKDQAEVVELRAFRDRVLMRSELGRDFVDLYYRLSPSAAELVREHESVRALLRTLLDPLAAGARLSRFAR